MVAILIWLVPARNCMFLDVQALTHVAVFWVAIETTTVLQAHQLRHSPCRVRTNRVKRNDQSFRSETGRGQRT